MNFGHGYKPSKYGAKKIIYNGEIAQYREQKLERLRSLIFIEKHG